MDKIKIGIFGASGYAGWELYQIMSGHPGVDIQCVTSETYSGEKLADIWVNGPDVVLHSADAVDMGLLDCVFLCLPHTQSAPYAQKAIASGTAVVDLSADLRLNDTQNYKKWYRVDHPAPQLLPVVYGLPEFYREEIKGKKIIANPGCYPTAVLLGVLPLADENLILDGSPIIIDAKSGTTGGGRKKNQALLFSEVYANFEPYKIGRVHSHIGEIEQQLALSGRVPGNLIFAPHLLPVARGILAAIYLQVADTNTAVEVIEKKYKDEPLVTVLPQGQLATLAHVVRTPNACISVTAADANNLIVNVAIDNLLKGAASQAVQNFNLMFGFGETTALVK